jgi:hypothetical protein
MTDYFDTGICPNRRALVDVYNNMMRSIDAEPDDELRRKMKQELKAFRILNLRWALLKFESDERQSR